MDPVLRLAKRYGLKIIEDAAEMHGQTDKGKSCGSFGDLSTFSFYSNKHITTGEGGMILTDSDELAEICRSLRNLCFQPAKRFVHERLGWNLRMTNLQAAVGLAQLERLDEFIIRKRAIGHDYTRRLQGINGVQLPLISTDYAENIYWVYGVVLAESLSVTVSQVTSQLSKSMVGSRPFFCPMHLQPVFIKMGLFKEQTFPVAEKLYTRGFYLPSGLALTDSQLENSANALRDALSVSLK